MSSYRDVERMKEHAYRYDDARSYSLAEKIAWTRDDRRREQRRRTIAVVFAVPPVAWLVLAFLLMWGLYELDRTVRGNPVQAALAVAFLVGVAVLWWRSRGKGGPTGHYTDQAPGSALVQASIEPVRQAHAAIAAALPPAYAGAVESGAVAPESVDQTANGVRYTVPLPPRVTADQFKPKAFAGVHDVPENRVRRATGPHPGVLLVDVLNMAPEDMPVPVWPLLAGALVDFTAPVPVGVTTAGEVVEAVYSANRCIYGGRSGSGKTWAMRLPVIAAALDPKVRLFVIDMKAETDWLPFERVADVFCNSGDHDRAAQIVREVVRERRKRAEMKRANPGFVPAPLVLVIDEFHNLPEWGPLTELMKEGRSSGITVILGTQAPTKGQIPTELTAQSNVRWCGKMNVDWQWRLVLGDELNRDEVKSKVTQVAGRGSALLVDDNDEANLIRGFKVSDDDIVRALARVPARQAPPTGDVQDHIVEPEGTILDDVLAMIGDDKGIRWPDLAVALDLDEEDLREELRELGIKSGKYRHGTQTNNGVRRVDVEAALRAD